MSSQLASSNPISAFQELVPPPALADRYVGIRVLWLKVIIRAVFDWVTYRDSNKLDKKKCADSAQNWLFNENELFNGLDNVCVILELSSERVRVWARSMSKDQVTKMEHLERDHDVGKKQKAVNNIWISAIEALQSESHEEY